MRRIAPIGLVLAATMSMPGCIIWDAYDQVELANQQLAAINETLTKIETTNTLLEHIEGNLNSIDAKLATIDENLDSVDGSLAEIRPMLGTINQHLASLRKTINNIDSTIPFLKLSGDDDEEQDALEAGEGGELPVEIKADPSLVPAEKQGEKQNDEKGTPPQR